MFLKRNLLCCTKLIFWGVRIRFLWTEMKNACLFVDNMALVCSALAASPRVKELNKDGAHPLEHYFSHSEGPREFPECFSP